ncbi:MAG: DUF1738 domain-containing protein [Gammaproteobacteria bacterium]|nr:DUF1738 domain-containing protein [Gammaproteobacteria bacterium]
MPAQKPRRDIHLEITNNIITMLENGQGIAGCPWYRDGSITRPINISTNKHYNGINVLMLWLQANKASFASGTWGTYRQWASRDAQVRRGEKGSPIVFYKPVERKNSDGKPERFLFARSSTVFNADQVEGYEPPPMPESTMTPIETVESLIQATAVTLEHGGDRAYYSPSQDLLKMPDIERFPDTESYYAVLMHELTHWTGHKSRCDRTDLKDYAFEELVAELGAAFLCADLGISATPREDHAGYLASWLKALRDDSKAIFRAASLASKAADYITAFGNDKEQAA